MSETLLPDRSVVALTGGERVDFLDGLVSCHVEDRPGALFYGALLTPQGKIVTDMMVHAEDARLLLDVPVQAADDLVRRLALYKLRADVEVTSTGLRVAVGGEGPADPRAPVLGGRRIVAPAALEEDAAALRDHTARRIAHGVPDAVADFELGEAFPHDVNMDLTGGVDFSKGCYVGQEVVSRMRHRGTARRRTVLVDADEELPEPGTPVTADGKVAGRLGSSVAGRGLAVVRIDKARGETLAGPVAIRLRVPEGAPFALGKGEDAA